MRIVGICGLVLMVGCSSGGGTNPFGGPPGPIPDGGSTPPPSGANPPCDQYLACAAQVAPMSVPPLISTYGPSGTCWKDASIAATCKTACQTGLDQLLMLHPEEPKCGGSAANAFCKGTPVATSCAKEILADIASCFSPPDDAKCVTAPLQDQQNTCFDSGATVRIPGSGDQRTVTWSQDGTVCATGTKVYGGTRQLTITRNGKTLVIDWDLGEITCPNGQTEHLPSSSTSGCDEADRIIGPVFPEWTDQYCGVGAC